jgi:hypothetical protein
MFNRTSNWVLASSGTFGRFPLRDSRGQAFVLKVAASLTASAEDFNKY